MSYDLFLVRVEPGTAPARIEALALAAAEAELPSDDASPEAEQRKQALARALRAVSPALESFPFDHAEIARLQGISEGEARRRHRHVELNGPEDGSGVQVTLHDEWASVTLPYWHRGAAAAAVWDEVWSYLRVLAGAGFAVYDPQLERRLDLAADRAAAESMYAEGVAATSRVAAQVASGEARRRPWWKFW